MRHWKNLVGWLLLATLAGCASAPQKPPQIERISADELAPTLPEPVPTLTTDEIVQLSKQGVNPDAIIARIKQSGSTYELLPSQFIDLAHRGVDHQVLDYMHAAREASLRDGCADEINKREREHRAESEGLKRQLQLRPYCGHDPFWGDPFWGPYPPYQGYPYYRYRR